MTTLRHQIRIEAPIEAVWKAVSVLTEVQHYNPMVASARFISDRREGVGAMRRCELKPKGWVEERVWEWSPPHVIGLEVAARYPPPHAPAVGVAALGPQDFQEVSPAIRSGRVYVVAHLADTTPSA